MSPLHTQSHDTSTSFISRTRHTKAHSLKTLIAFSPSTLLARRQHIHAYTCLPQVRSVRLTHVLVLVLTSLQHTVHPRPRPRPRPPSNIHTHGPSALFNPMYPSPTQPTGAAHPRGLDYFINVRQSGVFVCRVVVPGASPCFGPAFRSIGWIAVRVRLCRYRGCAFPAPLCFPLGACRQAFVSGLKMGGLGLRLHGRWAG